MDVRTLFLETLADLARRSVPRSSEYDLIKAAGLLRQLLLDGGRLVDLANRDERLTIRYTVGRSPLTALIMEDEPIFHARGDGLDPESGLPSTVAAALTLDAFLAEEIVYFNGQQFTVRDVVLYLSNVEGGVHSGVPRDEKDRALRTLTERIAIGGYPPAAQSIQAIARIVSRALEPLRDRLTSGG